MDNYTFDNIDYIKDSYLIDMLKNMDKRGIKPMDYDGSIYNDYQKIKNANLFSGDAIIDELEYIYEHRKTENYIKNNIKKEYVSTINVSQLKRIDIPLDIKNIKDGLSSDIISKLEDRLNKTSGLYTRPKELKEITFSTNPDDIKSLLSSDGISAIIKLFTNSNEFEFGDSNECLELFKSLVKNSEVNINKSLLKQPLTVKCDMSIKEFKIEYDINTKDFDVLAFNKRMEEVRKQTFNINNKIEKIDTPIYVDIYTNSIYFIQNIQLSFVSNDDIRDSLKPIIVYASIVDNLLQILHNNIKYKLDNKFAYTKKHSNILKLLSEVSNVGIMTVYDSDKDTVSLQFSPENAFGLSIDVKDKND